MQDLFYSEFLAHNKRYLPGLKSYPDARRICRNAVYNHALFHFNTLLKHMTRQLNLSIEQSLCAKEAAVISLQQIHLTMKFIRFPLSLHFNMQRYMANAMSRFLYSFQTMKHSTAQL